MFSRTLVAGAIVLASSFAFAYPAVGDKAEWDGQTKMVDGTTTPLKVTMEVTAWDPTTHMWTVKTDTTKGDQTTSETMTTPCLPTPDTAKMMLDKCVDEGGTLEDVSVKAGTYHTCMIIMGSAEGKLTKKWYGDTPFAMVKKWRADAADKSETELELTSVTMGK